jgi:hypothetical protein
MSVIVLVKYGLVALCGGLWTYGLIEQLGSTDTTATYLAISALMVAVSRL